MRAVRPNFFSAIVLCCCVAPAQAGPFFDCLRNETFTIPPIVTPWGSTQGNFIIHPGTQNAPVQNAPSDVFTSKLLDVLLTNLFSNIAKPVTTTGTTGTTDSDSMRRASDTLTKIESKMDRLESLINDRMSKLESDVTTVAKAQRESTAQLEQRLVETTSLLKDATDRIQVNADNINSNTKSIFRAQQETAMILGHRAIKKTSDKKLPKGKNLTRLDTNVTEQKDKELTVEVLGEIIDANGKKISIVRWIESGKSVVGTVETSDLQ